MHECTLTHLLLHVLYMLYEMMEKRSDSTKDSCLVNQKDIAQMVCKSTFCSESTGDKKKNLWAVG